MNGTRFFVVLLLALAASTAAVARPSQLGRVQIARLHYGGGGDWYCDPSSLPNWLELFQTRTGISTTDAEAVVTLDSEDLYQYPFLYVSGHGRIALEDRELVELRRYLLAGGFLFVDDNYGLDPSFRQLVANLFPDDEQTEKSLSRYRKDIATVTGLRFPNHDAYTFHITLAYQLKDLIPDETQEQQQVLKKIDNRLKHNTDQHLLRPPEFVIFNDMYAFYKDLVKRDKPK